MLGYEEYRRLIVDSLYEQGLISERLYEKCKKPSYIANLPGDLRSNDTDLLRERLDRIDEELTKRENILQKAETRINRKLKDNEKLSKRIEKNMDTMDTAMDKIADESDKIVKSVNKTPFEDKIKKWDSDSFDGDVKYFKNNLLINFKNFREAHNKFFSMELTESNINEYEAAFEKYIDASTAFKSGIELGYDAGIFTKGDIKNSDISANIKRIQSNINKYKKSGKQNSSDVESMGNNQKDIDYVLSQSKGVNKEIDNLLDEYMNTHNKYVDNGGSPRPEPNPQMILNLGAKDGDSFTFLPPNYNKYIV